MAVLLTLTAVNPGGAAQAEEGDYVPPPATQAQIDAVARLEELLTLQANEVDFVGRLHPDKRQFYFAEREHYLSRLAELLTELPRTNNPASEPQTRGPLQNARASDPGSATFLAHTRALLEERQGRQRAEIAQNLVFSSVAAEVAADHERQRDAYSAESVETRNRRYADWLAQRAAEVVAALVPIAKPSTEVRPELRVDDHLRDSLGGFTDSQLLALANQGLAAAIRRAVDDYSAGQGIIATLGRDGYIEVLSEWARYASIRIAPSVTAAPPVPSKPIPGEPSENKLALVRRLLDVAHALRAEEAVEKWLAEHEKLTGKPGPLIFNLDDAAVFSSPIDDSRHWHRDVHENDIKRRDRAVAAYPRTKARMLTLGARLRDLFGTSIGTHFEPSMEDRRVAFTLDESYEFARQFRFYEKLLADLERLVDPQDAWRYLRENMPLWPVTRARQAERESVQLSTPQPYDFDLYTSEVGEKARLQFLLTRPADLPSDITHRDDYAEDWQPVQADISTVRRAASGAAQDRVRREEIQIGERRFGDYGSPTRLAEDWRVSHRERLDEIRTLPPRTYAVEPDAFNDEALSAAELNASAKALAQAADPSTGGTARKSGAPPAADGTTADGIATDRFGDSADLSAPARGVPAQRNTPLRLVVDPQTQGRPDRVAPDGPFILPGKDEGADGARPAWVAPPATGSREPTKILAQLAAPVVTGAVTLRVTGTPSEVEDPGASGPADVPVFTLPSTLSPTGVPLLHPVLAEGDGPLAPVDPAKRFEPFERPESPPKDLETPERLAAVEPASVRFEDLVSAGIEEVDDGRKGEGGFWLEPDQDQGGPAEQDTVGAVDDPALVINGSGRPDDADVPAQRIDEVRVSAAEPVFDEATDEGGDGHEVRIAQHAWPDPQPASPEPDQVQVAAPASLGAAQDAPPLISAEAAAAMERDTHHVLAGAQPVPEFFRYDDGELATDQYGNPIVVEAGKSVLLTKSGRVLLNYEGMPIQLDCAAQASVCADAATSVTEAPEVEIAASLVGAGAAGLARVGANAVARGAAGGADEVVEATPRVLGPTRPYLGDLAGQTVRQGASEEILTGVGSSTSGAFGITAGLVGLGGGDSPDVQPSIAPAPAGLGLNTSAALLLREPEPDLHEDAGYTTLAEGTGVEYADPHRVEPDQSGNTDVVGQEAVNISGWTESEIHFANFPHDAPPPPPEPENAGSSVDG